MRNRKQILWWAGLLVLLFLINFLASRAHSRFDLTEEKRYSLSSTTKNLLQQLDDRLMIDVFLTGDLPADFRRLSNSTTEFLQVLREANNSRIAYRFLPPDEDAGDGKTWADSLKAMGIEPVNLSVQVKSGEEIRRAYPVAFVHYKGQTSVVNLYQGSSRVITPAQLNNAEAMMEYQFAKAIDGLADPSRPFVGYAVGNGEPTTAETYDLQQTVGSNYQLFLMDLKKQKGIPDTIRVLLIVKPADGFSDAEKLKIDQYIMRGGKVLWFIDNLYAEQDSLSYKDKLIAYDRNLNIQDMLFNYGVRINPDLLMDLQSDFLPFAVGNTPSGPQYEFIHWNYYPLFESRSNHIINKNLGLVSGRFVNSIDTIETPGIRKTFLLQSSANARTISTPALISPNENRNAPEDALFRKKDIPAAVLLEGKFTSLYRGRVTQAQKDSLAQLGGYRESSEENKMIVVADGDLVLNDVSSKQGPLPMGLNLFTVGSQYEYPFANRDFLMNCLEYLTSKTSIIETRNKEVVLRLLDTKKVAAEKSKWQLINIVLPILIVLLFGVAYHQLRRYRFGSAAKRS